MQGATRILRSTKSGKLYIKASDFFSQKEIQHLIEKLKASQIYKFIKEREASDPQPKSYSKYR